MTEGTLYCLSNKSMPGLLKVGFTNRKVEERARDLFTTGVPTEFTIEFARKVRDPRAKEKKLHALLEQYTERNDTRREFFRVSKEEVRAFFDLMEGEWWQPQEQQQEEEDIEEETDSIEADTPSQKFKSRDMIKCFVNGQRIRHTIGINNSWIGTYDTSKNSILYDGVLYKSLSGLAQAHYNKDKPERTSANGWAECECEVDGGWVSTY